MVFVKISPGWQLPESIATPESVFMNRRSFLVGLGSIALTGCNSRAAVESNLAALNLKPLPSQRNPQFTLDRELTDEVVAATYNNFYEFSGGKQVWKEVSQFQTHPWTVEVKGLVNYPKRFTIEELLKTMPLEERLYRHRCVETWAMAVPWIGFPLKSLLARVEPQNSARFVRFQTFYNPQQAPRQGQSYPWPYREGLTMEEAMNELTLLAVGIYGHELPKQHGAPIRLVVPWKYGFKSIKSIVAIELTDTQPATFWNTLVPFEYDFEANVNPNIPHPRWSQATERLLGTGERRPTLMFNGYGEYVAHLYR
jgi:sulfoxide reductase catalytic subunit YedY